MKRAKIIAIILALIMVITVFGACKKTEDTPAPAPGGASSEPAPAPADDGKTYILRIGTGTGGIHPQNVWMEAYKEALEEATDGRITVELYPAGQLGTMAELIQGLVDGSIDSGCFPSGYFSTIIPAVACSDLAFTFKNAEQLWRILFYEDTKYQAAFEQNGIVVGTWLRNCDRTLISTSLIESMDDLKGKVLWCMPSRVVQEEITLLGGVVSSIDTGEVAPSVQNGTLDGSVQDISLYRAQSLHNAGANYILSTPTGAIVTCFGISQIWWDKLPADLRTIVKDVANQTILDVEYPYIDSFVEGAYASMTAEGLQVIDPSAEFAAAMRDALAPQKDWFMGNTPDAVPIYDELLQFIANDK